MATIVLAVSVFFGAVLGAPLDEPQQQQAGLAGADKRQEKRGIGLAYTGLSGFGYDTSLGLTAYPATAYLTPTLIKSTYTVPAAASYHTTAYDATHGAKYAYTGFYPASYGGFGTTGYGAFAAPATYSKIVHPATSTYTKVIQTYPSATVGVVSAGAASPVVSGYGGVGSLGGYVY
uniref:Uncharacterized protein n=1 Tax=Anopheles atroparvus TaxID=41427 RepID=A0A182IJY7_ANOAO